MKPFDNPSDMADHRYILDQLFAAEVAMLAATELSTERERQALDTALRVIRRLRTKREARSALADDELTVAVFEGASI
jgi:hypothetical protein